MSTISLTPSCLISIPEEKKKTSNSNLEQIILKSIDEVFSSFGRSRKLAIYSKLEKTFNLKKRDLHLKTKDFVNALEIIFGPNAKCIELRIIAKIHAKTPTFVYCPEKKDLVFTDYITSLPRSLIE